MSRIKGRNTKPELVLRRALWALGLRYRLHTKLPGRPDITFAGRRLVVFIDGCFWHGCPKHGVQPKTNHEFWRDKLNSNIARDRRVTAQLRADGWKVVRVWEHEVKQDISAVVGRILKIIAREDFHGRNS
ncbi:MAG: very short patch repair endonuclease [Rhizobiales bacterium]|nr:very short patch repair endonuclease [Hyphomicrobiales bacterium]